MTIIISKSTPLNVKKPMIIDSFVAAEGQTQFTLSKTVTNENFTSVYINGIYQNKSTYSIVGDVLTVGGPLTAGLLVEVVLNN